MAKRKQLSDILALWDEQLDQAARDDRMSGYTANQLKQKFRLDCSSVLLTLAEEMELWTKRCDDAKRIPDVLHERAITIANCPVTTE